MIENAVLEVKSEILGRAIGRCLSKSVGLNAVYLPAGVPTSVAEAIVREANSSRRLDPPFAILVSESHPEREDVDCLRVWPPEDVISYRQDDRLAVVSGRHTDLQSVASSFAEVLGLSFPALAANNVTLDQIATEALSVVVVESGILGVTRSEQKVASKRLAICLAQLVEIYEASRLGDETWNSYWFAHANMALNGLVAVLSAHAVSNPAASVAVTFERFTFASFGFPNPGAEGALPRKSLGRKYATAVDEWWGDQNSIESALSHLRHHPDSPESSLGLRALDWRTFDQYTAALGHPLLALMRHDEDISTAVEAFAGLTTDQFFDPTNRGRDKEGMTVFGCEGEDLAVGAQPGTGPFIIQGVEQVDSTMMTEIVRVKIPTLATVNQRLIDQSQLSLEVTPTTVSWDGTLEIGPDGVLWAVGRFLRELKGKKPKPFVVATVRVARATSDTLAPLVPTSAVCVVHIAPSFEVGMAVYRLSAQGGAAKPTYVGPQVLRANEAPQSAVAEDVFAAVLDDARATYQVVLWGERSGIAPLHNGRAISPHKHRSTLFSTEFNPGDLDVFEIDGVRFELRASEPTSALQSPIVAAIGKAEVSGSRPNESTVDSVRGVFETLFSTHGDEPQWAAANGHVVIVGNNPEIPLDNFASGRNSSAFLMNPHTQIIWDDFIDDTVPDELVNSVQAEFFRSAFAELGVHESLELIGDESAISREWPSRTSWRHLWLEDRRLLDNYLSAYSELVEKAREIGSPLGIFWATFPYSVSVWEEGSSLQSSAVLLSPLHPVRLAWLASVEGTLWNSQYALDLAGTIEGWNMPLFGPRHTRAGRMVAMPMDTGEGQIFLGWSMLVAASVDDERPLTAPHRVGPLAAPGTAASGLNATAATSALRSYRRMHPHVSTLTIDLAASSKTPRLTEVDESVLAQLEAWSNEKSGDFRGGARVLDSLAREGEVPFAAVAELAKRNPTMPLMWSRYNPIFTSQTCNIRLLQDSGVAIVVGPGNSTNLGVVGDVPLRRFEAGEAPQPNAKRAVSRPAIEPGRGGWVQFEKAIASLEISVENPQITSKLHRSVLVDDRADWIVSGESLLSPSAMASLMQGSGAGAQMLWEWRPPFLEAAADVPVLERRPFVSVARVPHGFRTQLRDLLERATGNLSSDAAVDDLLGKLGARGVGLSSLLAMGGTHAAGALGFYLSFALAEKLDGKDGAEYLALPIDACDTFLKALAGRAQHGNPTQRADLLMIRLDDTGVTLVPVEIKFYGMNSSAEGGALPGATDYSLSEARDQLVSTSSLLRALETRGREAMTGTADDRSLWLNALATLVEAAVRLKPAGSMNSSDLPARLQSLLLGRLPVRAGRPIVAFFKHDALTQEGRTFRAEINVPSQGAMESFAALIANSSAAFDAIGDDANEMISAWRVISDWAFDVPAEPSVPIQTSPTGTAPAVELGIANDGASFDAAFGDRSFNKPTFRSAKDSAPQVTQPRILTNEGVRFDVGGLTGTIGDARADFWPGNTALNQMNIGVVGDLGTGKTQLSKALILQLRAEAKSTQLNPLSILIFDYKEDFQNSDFLDAVGGYVLKPHRIPLNIFALEEGYTPRAAFQRASAFFDTIAKIYPGVGAVQRDRLTTVITDLYEDLGGEAPTLAEVRQRYVDLDKPDSVTGILNNFVKGEVFSDDRSKLLSFDELIHDRVLVVGLSDFGADQNSKNSLVALFLNVYYDYMRRSTKWPFVGENPQTRKLNSFLLVDEATNIMKYEFDVLMDLMLQGREFGFGVILASQYLSHFKPSGSTNYGEPLLTWFIHKVPNVTLRQLEQLGIPGATQNSAENIASLPLHGAFYASLNFPGRFITGTPFYKLVGPTAGTA